MIRNLGFNKILWLSLALLCLVAALIGVSNPGIYDKVITPEVMPGVLSQDVVTIVAAIVLLALAMATKETDAVRPIVIWGIIGFLFYAYGVYAFERVYNMLYLLYMVILALSFYTLIYGVACIRPEILPAVRLSNLARRVSIGVSLFIPLMFNILWITSLLPMLRSGTKPEFFYSIYILDLCFIMPAYVIMAVLMIKKRGLGFLLAPAMFVLGVILLFPVGIGELLKPIYNLPVDTAGLKLYLGLSLFFLVVALFHLKNMRIDRKSGFSG